MRIALSLLIALGSAVVLRADPHPQIGQGPASASGVLMGRVVEATTGVPVRGALVRLNAGPKEFIRPGSPAVFTDADGQFVFGGVPSGSYRLWATKFGYTESSYGQRRPTPSGSDAPLLVLAADERRADLTMRIWKHAAITGTVTDEYGEPLVGITVRAFPRIFIAGRPKLGANAMEQARTDDRGVYRLPRLVAGDYVVAIIRVQPAAPSSLATEAARVGATGDEAADMAMFMDVERAGLSTPRLGSSSHVRVGSSLFGIEELPPVMRSDRLLVYPSQFFGGASHVASARVLALKSGDEASGIDFVMKAVPSVRVSGQVTDQNGPVANMPVRLTPAGSGDFEIDRLAPGAATITDADGRFTLLGVTPGTYVLRAFKGPNDDSWGIVEAFSADDSGTVISTPREIFTAPPPPPKSPTFTATTTIAVGGTDLSDISVIVHNGARLAGEVVFTGTHDPPGPDDLKRLSVRVEARDGNAPSWDFNMSAKVTPDRRFETNELPAGSYLVRVPSPPSGWTLQAITSGGLDLSDVPIDLSDKSIGGLVVTFTDKPSQLAGTVRAGSNGDRVDDGVVLVFPVDRARWADYGASPRRLAEAAVAHDGGFTVTGLPGGEYFVAAIRDDFLTDWRDPAFLGKISGLASRVTIGPGDQRSVGLVMERVR